MSKDILEKMLKIELPAEDSFRIIRETLTRMGVRHKSENKLYQSAHILHKKGEFYICHFKEMFSLDGKESNITPTDIARRNTIAALLREWGLIRITNEEIMTEFVDMSAVKVVSFKEKPNWELIPKYTIGKQNEKHRPR